MGSQNSNWELIYNCGKALRHTSVIRGGDSYHQWRGTSSYQEIYDLDLLDLSKRLLSYGLRFAPFHSQQNWERQLNQTAFHYRETYEAIHERGDSIGERLDQEKRISEQDAMLKETLLAYLSGKGELNDQVKLWLNRREKGTPPHLHARDEILQLFYQAKTMGGLR